MDASVQTSFQKVHLVDASTNTDPIGDRKRKRGSDTPLNISDVEAVIVVKGSAAEDLEAADWAVVPVEEGMEVVEPPTTEEEAAVVDLPLAEAMAVSEKEAQRLAFLPVVSAMEIVTAEPAQQPPQQQGSLTGSSEKATSTATVFSEAPVKEPCSKKGGGGSRCKRWAVPGRTQCQMCLESKRKSEKKRKVEKALKRAEFFSTPMELPDHNGVFYVEEIDEEPISEAPSQNEQPSSSWMNSEQVDCCHSPPCQESPP